MDDPSFVIRFPNASRAETLKSCMSPAVQIVDAVFHDTDDVVAHIAAGRTVRLKGIPTIGVMLNKAVDGTMLSACADDFQYNEADANPVCSLYSNRIE
jgi:hypothetical protein